MRPLAMSPYLATRQSPLARQSSHHCVWMYLKIPPDILDSQIRGTMESQYQTAPTTARSG